MKRATGILLTLVGVVLALVTLAAIGTWIAISYLPHERAVRFDAPGVLAIDLTGPVVERAPTDLLTAQLEGSAVELLDVALSLDRARSDDRIAGVVLRVGPPRFGWAMAEEIRDRLRRFRESGKFVYAFVDVTDELGYYAALPADSIFLLPNGGMELNGFRVEAPFIKDLLDKLGVQAQVEAEGVYKSAADIFRRRDMSPADREATGAILEQRYMRFLDAVTTDRKVPRDRFEAAFDRGVYLARDLRSLDLVDADREPSDVDRAAVARAVGAAPDSIPPDEVAAHIIDLRDYARDLPGPSSHPRGTIGLVYAVGAMTRGESGFDPVFGRTMGSRTMVDLLQEVGQDDALDAVVLRIDSPGGDALASEEMWGAVRDLARRLPVVVSMGDVAASGGYYLAAAGERIVASPSTITGSIGVFGVLFNAGPLYDKVGVRWDTLSTSAGADFPTSIRALDEGERATFRELIQATYQGFLTRVAEGRGMPVADVDRVARGRVWTGTDAAQRGLVDELGGLEAAMAAAKKAAGLEPTAQVRLHVYPRKEGLIDKLRDALRLQGIDARRSAGATTLDPGGVLAQGAVRSVVVREAARVLTGLAAALEAGPGRPLAVLPYLPVVR